MLIVELLKGRFWGGPYGKHVKGSFFFLVWGGGVPYIYICYKVDGGSGHSIGRTFSTKKPE